MSHPSPTPSRTSVINRSKAIAKLQAKDMHQISVRFSPDVFEELLEAAEARNVSVASIINQVVEKALRERFSPKKEGRG